MEPSRDGRGVCCSTPHHEWRRKCKKSSNSNFWVSQVLIPSLTFPNALQRLLFFVDRRNCRQKRTRAGRLLLKCSRDDDVDVPPTSNSQLTKSLLAMMNIMLPLFQPINSLQEKSGSITLFLIQDTTIETSERKLPRDQNGRSS